MNLERELQLCREGDRKAQWRVYSELAPAMLSVCSRYTANVVDAESVMMAGFLKVFTKISKYSDKGEFRAWVRRIMVNESLMFLRANKNLDRPTEDIYLEIDRIDSSDDVEMELCSIATQDEIHQFIQLIPTKSRAVFNLYVLDGYRHRDIAEELNISEGTSRAHLKRARAKLRELLTAKMARV